MPSSGPKSTGPKLSSKMNGSTIRRCAEDSTPILTSVIAVALIALGDLLVPILTDSNDGEPKPREREPAARHFQ